MADNLNSQNSSVPADQPLGDNGGSNDSLTPSPAKSPLEEAGVEPNPIVSNEPTLAEQPVTTPQPEVAAPEMPVAQDDPMATSTLPNPEPVGSSLPNTDIAPLVADVPPADPAMPSASPIPAGAPDPMNMPDAAVPSMPTQPAVETPGAPAPVPAPNTDNTPEVPADSGEPSEAPDTDEFLQSILDNKPQGQASDQPAETAPESPASGMTSATGEPETPGTQTPSQPPVPNSSLEIEPPAASAPFIAPSPAETAPALTELAGEPAAAPLEQPTDAMMPEMATNPDMSQANPPVMGSSVDSSPAAQPGATDSLSSTTSPMTDSPDQSVASDIFSKKPTQSAKSPVKLIAIVLLAAVVLGGIYFGAKKYFFPAATSSTTQNGLGIATPVSSAIALTGDVARKTDLKATQQALLNLYSANGKYPVAVDYVKLSQAGNVVEKELVPNYLSKLPTDLDKTRAYQYKSDGTTFTLTAVLDNQSDAGVSMENGVALYKVDQSTDVLITTGAATSVTTAQTTSGSASADSSNLF